MNREERIYSVTMTEDELRLFSEFLDQKDFDKPAFHGMSLQKTDQYAKDSSEEKRKSSKTDEFTIEGNEISKNLFDNEGDVVNAQISRGRLAMTPGYNRDLLKKEDGDYLGKVNDGHHRMSSKYIKDKDELAQYIVTRKRDLNKDYDEALERFQTDLENANKSTENDSLKERSDLSDRLDNSSVSLHNARVNSRRFWDYNYKYGKQLNQIAKDSKDIINKESDLSKSKYDDKYSSKRIEKFLDKKIDADKAKNIVDRRHAADIDYLAKDTEKGRDRDKFRISDIGRKWDDTGIVYNEALGRDLNKDAAIAAGVTAGLVGGGIALRKHLKKKKQEKEIAEKKYKTSDKKKK